MLCFLIPRKHEFGSIGNTENSLILSLMAIWSASVLKNQSLIDDFYQW